MRIPHRKSAVAGPIAIWLSVFAAAPTLLTIADCVLMHRKPGLKRTLHRLLWYSWPIRRCKLVTAISQFSVDELTAMEPATAGKTHAVHVSLPHGPVGSIGAHVVEQGQVGPLADVDPAV